MKNRLENILNELQRENMFSNADRTAGAEPIFDYENRTIRHIIMTDTLADDGGILLPEGLGLDRFNKTRSVLVRHGLPEQAAVFDSPVIARNLSLKISPHEVEAVTQFAETELGEQYAYLYGLNDKKEIYARSWSARADIFERGVLTVERAKTLLGINIDTGRLPALTQKTGQVWIGIRTELKEYSVVPVGADRDALTRAAREGITVASAFIADLDFQESKQAILALREENKINKDKLDKFERDMLALSREGAAAAERGDTAEILREIQECVRIVKGK